MYQRDAVQNLQSGKFSSLNFLRKPQRISCQVETTAMNDALKRNTDLNKSKIIVDKSLQDSQHDEHDPVGNELAGRLNEKLNFNKDADPSKKEDWDVETDPLKKEAWESETDPSLSMQDYFPVSKPDVPEVEINNNSNDDNDDDDDEPEDRYLDSRKLSAIFNPPSILLTRSKSLPTSPLEGRVSQEQRPPVFKRSKSVHFAQSEKFEVKYFREDESPLFLRNESGEYGTKSGKLRKSRRHRSREAVAKVNGDDDDDDMLNMKGSKRSLELVNGNLILQAQTPKLLRLDVFGVRKNQFQTFANGIYNSMNTPNSGWSNSLHSNNAPFWKYSHGINDNDDNDNNNNNNKNEDDANTTGIPNFDFSSPFNTNDSFKIEANLGTFICHLQDLRLDTQGHMLIGNVIVRNISYEKRVIVRYTLDSWKSQQDVESVWITNHCNLKSGTGAIDIDVFQFAIDLGKINTIEHIEMCILYQTREGSSWIDHWDNNSGQNYKVSVRVK